MTRHLVIGASGQVGEHLTNSLNKEHIEVVGTFTHHPFDHLLHLDISKRENVFDLLSAKKPEVVFLPASLTYVDYCEQNPQEAYDVNVNGVKNVIDASQTINAKVVYFSSDYVFDGKNGPYEENDVPNPINVYGAQKIIAEHLVATQVEDFLIIRTTVVYGWEKQGKNFIYRLIKGLEKGETFKVPQDQIGTPTYAPDLADAVVDLVKRKKKGIYHIVGPDLVDRYTFACQAAEIFGLPQSLIQGVTTSELNQIAARPLNAGMKTQKVNEVLQTSFLGYRDGLKMMESEKEAYL